MIYHPLGSSDLNVSEICLGSMTWGIQNNQNDANHQLDCALAHGINFVDTAEMYPVPPNKETYGGTERIIGQWLRNNSSKRSDLVIASKIAGPGIQWIRQGSKISVEAIEAALNDSLARLQTDYIDVYQLHWPNRTSPHFSKHWPNQIKFSEVDTQQHVDEMHQILFALSNNIKSGKIRHFGLSDDTPWGIQTYLSLAKEHNLPKPVSIQNEFSLVHAKDWPYLIEQCIHEKIAYLPWSPLAGGMLTGKYLDGKRPAGSRWTLMQRQGLFRDSAIAQNAVLAYRQLAEEIGITPAQLALAWCKQIDGVTSTIIGATSIEQLEENIAAFSIVLDQSQLENINQVLQRYPLPF